MTRFFQSTTKEARGYFLIFMIPFAWLTIAMAADRGIIIALKFCAIGAVISMIFSASLLVWIRLGKNC